MRPTKSRTSYPDRVLKGGCPKACFAALLKKTKNGYLLRTLEPLSLLKEPKQGRGHMPLLKNQEGQATKDP